MAYADEHLPPEVDGGRIASDLVRAFCDTERPIVAGLACAGGDRASARRRRLLGEVSESCQRLYNDMGVVRYR